MTNFTKKTESKSEILWVLIVRIIGALMFILPMYLPMKAYLFTDIENVIMSLNDMAFSCVGFLLFAGGKNLGVLANNIGIAINNVLTKLTK